MHHRDLRFHTSSVDDEEFAQIAALMIEGLILTNMYEIERDGDALPCCPPCGGVRYVEPLLCKDCDPVNHPCQDVYDVRTMMKKRKATCYDLMAERVARLRLKDYDARAVVDLRFNAYDKPIPGGFHAYVWVADDDTTEDPAEELRLHPDTCAGGRACSCKGDAASADGETALVARVAGIGQVIRARMWRDSPGGLAHVAIPGRVA